VRFAPKFLVSCFWVLELSLLDNIDKGNLSLPFYPSLVNLLFHLFLLLSTSNHLSCIVNPLFVHKKQVELTIISLVLIIAFGLLVVETPFLFCVIHSLCGVSLIQRERRYISVFCLMGS